jgi:hypothetical protein
MAQETFTKESFWAELDALGEDEVRVRLSVTKQFGDVGPKHELAKLWLARKDSAKRDVREESTLRLAVWANIIAITAIVIAAIAHTKKLCD